MERPDQLFEGFRRSGDPEALGCAFDAVAPRLLQLAVHLVGDLAAAEDLVQATFVTAIERAATFDASRDLEAWLSGILGNHARDLRKAARRHVDVEALTKRIEATPLERALEAEWSAALAEAIDRVPEPYRLVLILRLQYGMGSAEIAHALQRSPGAVRVQLHRGRELLRKLLPAGLVASAVFIAEPGRGLAQVKANVVAHAALVKGSVGVAGVAGGLIVSSKVLISAVAIVVALLALFLARSRESAQEAAPTLASTTPTEVLHGSSVAHQEVIAVNASNAPALREVAPTSADSDLKLVKVHGRVFDADSGAGIAGSHVSFFRPQLLRFSEIRRRWHGRFQVFPDGTVFPMGWPKFGPIRPGEVRADTEFPTSFTNEARLDAEDLVVYAPPASEVDPIARAVTNASGEFDVVLPETLGFAVCRADGYGAGQKAFSPMEVNRANAGELSIQIALCAAKRLAGFVVDETLKRIERPIRLAFSGHVFKPAPISVAASGKVVSGDLRADEQMDEWTIETAADGTFECELPAKIVRAASLEPDLGFVKQGHLREEGAKFVHDVWPEPGRVDEPLVIVLQSVASILVRDRATGAPIEDFRLECTRGSNGLPLRFGRFFAPRGHLRLAADNAVMSGAQPRDDELSRCECRVWAEGYLPTTKHLRDLTRPGVTEFELERGELPAIVGRVHDGERAIASARISIAMPVFEAWTPPGHVPIEMALSDADGAFRLCAPRGRYLLHVVADDQDECRVVEIPNAAPVDIDFSIDTAIVVDVHESSGAPCVNREVLLRGDDGRRVKANTDAKGVACFSRLTPGGYSVQTMNAAVRVASKPDREARVDLHLGERARADLLITDASPRFARLVVDGAPSLTGWKAHRHHLGEDGPSVNVELNGRIPTDIRGLRLLQIVSPEAREWTAFLPGDAPDGYEIRITLDGLAYEGVVTSHTTGRPMSGLQLIARPWEAEDGISTMATTDDRGRFKLDGLVDGDFSIYFKRGAGEPWFEVEGIYLHTTERPRSPPTQLAIALPRRKGSLSHAFGAGGFDGVAELSLSGRIHKAAGPLPRVSGFIGSCFPHERYTLMLFTRLDVSSDGSFEAMVPAAPSFHASLRDGPTSIGEFDWKATGTSDREVHDFELR